MNKQNFTSNDRFPLSTESLAFMQEMIGAAAGLARIGGNNYILSGCEKSGNNIAPGVIVVNGEVMPFEGGATVSSIVVVETPKSISANGLTFKDARVERYAKFATGTGVNYLPWANFKPLQTNEQLEKAKATVKYVDNEIEKIQSGSIPSGVIVMWSGSVSEIPDGWQLCDYSIIKGTNKRTPDLRGRFIVGYNVDDSDYNVVSDDLSQAKKGGAKTVALSFEEMPSHTHSVNRVSDDESMDWDTDFAIPCTNIRNIGNVDFHLNYAGGNKAHENRPPYYVLAFIIKL